MKAIWVVLCLFSAVGCASNFRLELQPGDLDPPPPASLETPAAERRAAEWAPVLWFAVGEAYYPTLPFFSAFDGCDNDNDGLVDWEDPSEIAPLGDRGLSYAQFDAMYRALSDSTKRSVASVIYRARRYETARLRKILRSDRQAWDRIDDFVREQLTSPAAGTALEYYFYYVRDTGVIGHPGDLERITVFVPDHSSRAVLVGAAHNDDDPNAVAIVEEGQRPHVLVELGGHASTPDADADGSFTLGVDAIWNVDEVWGVRDLVSTTGRGAIGPYQDEFTFPRTDKTKLAPHSHGGSDGYSLLRMDRYLTELEDLERARVRYTPDSASLGAAARRAWVSYDWQDEADPPRFRVASHASYRQPPEAIFAREVFHPGLLRSFEAFSRIRHLGPPLGKGIGVGVGMSFSLKRISGKLAIPGVLSLRASRHGSILERGVGTVGAVINSSYVGRTSRYFGYEIWGGDRPGRVIYGVSVRPFKTTRWLATSKYSRLRVHFGASTSLGTWDQTRLELGLILDIRI